MAMQPTTASQPNKQATHYTSYYYTHLWRGTSRGL